MSHTLCDLLCFNNIYLSLYYFVTLITDNNTVRYYRCQRHHFYFILQYLQILSKSKQKSSYCDILEAFFILNECRVTNVILSGHFQVLKYDISVLCDFGRRHKHGSTAERKLIQK